ncbi:flagellar hook-length control protein FliK [Sporosarcina cyprini]|uniref:flagellar hook-length control protein FliK n=1 Tax=Sporosarcina cyprini TaxID=2910523 RepID=UPI001EE0F911|nr:flagellar hook-length control protein FliK [Sporosarcina cyprini]MCG3090099.1 flagellar hook-length control protein FliK [Sporosarcina cyprini]
MNIGSLQNLLGVTSQQLTSSPGTSAGQGSQSFGSVFASATSLSINNSVGQQTEAGNQMDAIQAIFNALDLPSLEEALEATNGTEMTLPENGPFVFKTIKEFADLLSLDADSLMGSLKTLLQEAGLSKEKLEQLDDETPLWTLIGFVDEVAPRFFANLSDSLSQATKNVEGASSIQVLTLLKAFEIVAPKTDMVLSQEQKLASLQFSLSQSGTRITETLEKGSNNKVEFMHLMQKTQSIRILTDSSQSEQPKDQSNSQSKSEQPVHSAHQAVYPTVSKSETVTVQTGQTQENRSETLMKEMQLLFKRANFGQAGGSNRMLIKLYPEHLGQIRIELHETNGIISARILASTALAKEMLDSQMHQLRHAFNQQNVQVDRIDITQSVQEPTKEREQAFNEQYKREQQGEDSKNEQSTETETLFEEYLIELEV